MNLEKFRNMVNCRFIKRRIYEKKVASILIAAITVMGMFAGCSGTTEKTTEETSAQTEDDIEGNIQEEAGGSSVETSGTDSTDNPTGSPAVYMTTDIKIGRASCRERV